MKHRQGFGPTYQRVHALGQLPTQRAHAHAMGQVPTAPAPEPMRNQPEFVEVPAFYTASVLIGGEPGATAGATAALRPERFVCRRITYAAQADSPPFSAFPFGAPLTGNCVEISWGDEFTKFLGEQPALLAALFGNSNGFLDLPEGILFQGRQSLSVKLRRLQWPSTTDPLETRIDIVFHGVGLLPRNTGGVSGSL